MLTYFKLLVFAVYVVLSVPGIVACQWVANFGLMFALSLIMIGLSLALRIIEVDLLNYILASGASIRYLNLYRLADIWVSLLSATVTGAIIAVMRFVPLIPFMGIALMRTDATPLPLAYESEHYDAAKAVYSSPAVLLQPEDSQYSQYSHPIKCAFA